MSKYVTKLSANGEILLAEEYVDHDEKTDINPETKKPGIYHVTAEEGARVRARSLAIQLEPGEKVIVGDEPYQPEATPDIVQENAADNTETIEEVENA